MLHDIGYWKLQIDSQVGITLLSFSENYIKISPPEWVGVHYYMQEDHNFPITKF